MTSGRSTRLNALAAGESTTINLPDNQYYMAMDMTSGSEIMYLTDLTGEECADKLNFSNSPIGGKSTDVTPEWDGTYTSCIVKWLEKGVGVAHALKGVSESNGQTNNGSGSNMATTVQLPTFVTVSVSTTVSVPDGGTILLGGIKRWSETTRPSSFPTPSY